MYVYIHIDIDIYIYIYSIYSRIKDFDQRLQRQIFV